MSGTTTKTDIKEQTEATLQKKVDMAVQSFVTVERKVLWEIADIIQEMTQRHFYTREKAQGMLRRAFCKAHNVSKSDKSSSPEYNNFSSTVVRVGLVGSLNPQVYHEVRSSGRSLTAVWAEMMGDGGKLVRKLEHMKPKVEAVESSNNVDEFAHLEDDMKETKEEKKPEQTGWTAPEASGGYDGNKMWIKEGKEIARSEPNVLVQLFQTLMNKNLLDSALRKTLIGILED